MSLIHWLGLEDRVDLLGGLACSSPYSGRKPTWMWSSWSGMRERVVGALERHQRDDLVRASSCPGASAGAGS